MLVSCLDVTLQSPIIFGTVCFLFLLQFFLSCTSWIVAGLIEFCAWTINFVLSLEIYTLGSFCLQYPTKALSPLMLEDYRKVMVDRRGEQELFSNDDIMKCMKKGIWFPSSYHNTIFRVELVNPMILVIY